MRIGTRIVAVLAAALTALTAAGCATTRADTGGSAGVIDVVAAENIWGDLAAQLGGVHARVRNMIDNPNADPHDYEPTGPDARAVAGARLVIVNGIGYDEWATRLVAAGGDETSTVLTVGDVVGVAPGGNPHRWYSPTDVRTVIDAVTAAYTAIEPSHAAYFAARHDEVLGTALKPYFDLVADIRAHHAGTPVGASESIFAPLAEATGLDLKTPAAFLTAISEGSDPTAADKATIDAQITGGQIKVYVYNSQNATPDVAAQVAAARAAGIPVTTITETPTPAGAHFQDWQVAQLTALRDALAAATR
jgi:zinc/manganese transport system substrate-binding protein